MPREPRYAKPAVTTLKRLESRWVKTYDELIAARDALPHDHPDKATIRKALMWMERQDNYATLNLLIDTLEGITNDHQS